MMFIYKYIVVIIIYKYNILDPVQYIKSSTIYYIQIKPSHIGYVLTTNDNYVLILNINLHLVLVEMISFKSVLLYIILHPCYSYKNYVNITS